MQNNPDQFSSKIGFVLAAAVTHYAAVWAATIGAAAAFGAEPTDVQFELVAREPAVVTTTADPKPAQLIPVSPAFTGGASSGSATAWTPT